MKRTPKEWQEHTGIKIMDPDGWRGANGKSFDEAIDEAEWQQRMQQSTVSHAGIPVLPPVAAANAIHWFETVVKKYIGHGMTTAREQPKILHDILEDLFRDRDLLEKCHEAYPRALKLMEKGRRFIVIADDEPYLAEAYHKIRSQQLQQGKWTTECEKQFKEAIKDAPDYWEDRAMARQLQIDETVIARENVGDMLFWSFRYGIGRMTYAVSSIARMLILYNAHISASHRETICREIDAAIAEDRAGNECDIQAWREVWEALRNVK